MIKGRREAQGCTFCRAPLDGERSTACAACGTWLHDACWTELPGCPTAGCAGGDARESPAIACVYCRRRIARGGRGTLRSEELWDCPGCGALGHPPCWGDRCPTSGCHELPDEVRAQMAALANPFTDAVHRRTRLVLVALIGIMALLFAGGCLVGILGALDR